MNEDTAPSANGGEALKRKRRPGRSTITDLNRPLPLRDYAAAQGWSASTRRRRIAQGLPVTRRAGMPDIVVPARADALLFPARAFAA